MPAPRGRRTTERLYAEIVERVEQASAENPFVQRVGNALVRAAHRHQTVTYGKCAVCDKNAPCGTIAGIASDLGILL